MTPRFVFRRAARVDLLDARNWYDAQRSGLGAEFAHAIDAAIERIGEQPAAYAEVGYGTRRAVLLDFPYAIFFRVHTNRIEVIAVFHHRRNPRVWQARAAV
jgi:toxin ParE1/3/4